MVRWCWVNFQCRAFILLWIIVGQGPIALGYPVGQHTFVSPSAFSRRAVVSYWRKYVHEALVNRLGGLSLPRKSVVRLTDRPDMTLDVYRGRKTTIQPKPIALAVGAGWGCLDFFKFVYLFSFLSPSSETARYRLKYVSKGR